LLKIIKSFAAFALTAVLLIIPACGDRSAPAASTSNPSTAGKISIVATIFPPYDFARQITGGKADLTLLLPPGSESHSYEPTPQDILKIRNCDVFIQGGGESDAWVSEILAALDTSGMRIVTLMDCVTAVGEELAEGMEGGENPDSEAEYDEHVWTSPRNAKLIVQKISDTIIAADSENAENADTYRQNTADYLEKLDELDTLFQNVADSAARKEIIFGDRFPFRYFADAYNLTYYAAFPGCSTETEASAATVAFLIDKVKNNDIPAVFHIELSSEKMAQTIADSVKQDTGREIQVLLLHSCHNLSKADFEAGATYLSLMNGNIEALKIALN
jgi:zinc transport system substrate-binding protein